MTRGTRALVACSLAAIAAAAVAATPTGKTAATGKVSATATPAPTASAPAAAAAPVEFTGTFLAGTTYLAEMVYDARVLKTWRPVKDVQPGPNTAWSVAWTNLDQFPALKTASAQAKHQRFRFRVTKADVVSGSPQLPWMATYHCEVLAVEPVAAPPKQQPTGKRR
nr:hypothetical protein [Caldimonas sp.]